MLSAVRVELEISNRVQNICSITGLWYGCMFPPSNYYKGKYSLFIFNNIYVPDVLWSELVTVVLPELEAN